MDSEISHPDSKIKVLANQTKMLRLKYVLVALLLFPVLLNATSGSQQVRADSNETAKGDQNATTQASITAGELFSCAVLDTGNIKCWGTNGLGQLGNGTTSQSSSPVDVLSAVGGSALSGVTAISAGAEHICALLDNGTVKCWGNTSDGRVGDGTQFQSAKSIPSLVSGLTGVTAISAGYAHTCVLLSTGSVKCWGANGSGRLGNGNQTLSPTPVDVLTSAGGLALSGVSAISAGKEHTCALLNTGTVKCWGNNGGGQIGDTTYTTPRLFPTDVATLSGVTAISAGDTHTCALLNTGTVKCWGYNMGELGDGSLTQSETPVAVSGLSGVTAISSAKTHTCARTTSGTVKCWGNNAFGQIGDGTTTARKTPVNVTGLSEVLAVSASYQGHSCAILTTGAIRCWGRNGDGQLGDGSTSQRTTSVQVTGLTSGVGLTTTTSIAQSPNSETTQTETPSADASAPSLGNAAATPGVTVTDSKIYSTPPRRVAEGSSISVLSASQTKTQRLRTATPAVCLTTNDDIVFIDTGACNVSVLSKKTGKVLRQLRTTVIDSDVVELGIGNEIATIAPIYFGNGSASLSTAAKKRIASLKDRISDAGSVLVVGHSGIMTGDTEENRALSSTRAVNTVRQLKKAGAVGPFFSIAAGALDPEVKNTARSAQAKNRRVVVILVP